MSIESLIFLIYHTLVPQPGQNSPTLEWYYYQEILVSYYNMPYLHSTPRLITILGKGGTIGV